MNGLEALEEIKDDMEYVTRLDFVEPIVRGEVQKNLFKIYHRELPQLDLIEKELKALEIIKNKGIDIITFKAHKKAKTYNEHTKFAYCKDYTDEEFDLLKEVLEK